MRAAAAPDPSAGTEPARGPRSDRRGRSRRRAPALSCLSSRSNYVIHLAMARQLIGVLVIGWLLAPRPDANDAFDAFWAAESPEAAARLADDVVKSGVTFDAAYSRLKQGRAYAAQPTGMIRLKNRTG